ncbi:molybdopterin-binding domain-containing protein [Aureliella helgolandensis]|uniref:Uncharacterized protein n=1 Tax=Aureliella helgolandensis TaxID=2527968 RepID=A0A518GED2_9BACT|nr:hypothetical protein [Aureliella helgolandensis]QDV26961.1 hypothetical protein Q31a_53410 [Aureliella helgolandensis]
MQRNWKVGLGAGGWLVAAFFFAAYVYGLKPGDMVRSATAQSTIDNTATTNDNRLANSDNTLPTSDSKLPNSDNALILTHLCGVKPIGYESGLSTKTYSLAPLISSYSPLDVQLQSAERLIRGAIAPDSWRERGGTGVFSIDYPNQSIVVSQEERVHKKIEKLLASLEEFLNQGGRGVLVKLASAKYR